MSEKTTEQLRNELIFQLNAIGNYETHKDMWDAFYRYEEHLKTEE